ncbi:MAG: hypothetical protein LBP92_13595 [Deltaproteobacteria bacterium]|jgi:nitrogen fixation/metabolism regulation signal transduction histidine kinase|nr:hypothetical protein [Deltaproteobacteria bacterium]
MRILESSKSLVPAFNPGIWPALEWSPEFWLTLFDKLHYPVLVFDGGGKIILANSESERLLCLGGLVGSTLPSYLGPLLDRGLEMGGLLGRPVHIATCEGDYSFIVKTMPFEGLGNLLVAAGLREHLEWPSETSNPDGLDSLDGSVAMAGKVSQEVRGPLAGIELYASILDDEIDKSGDGALKGLINEIRESLREVNEYLTSFESMTRSMRLDLETLNLIEVVDEALAGMGGVLKAKNIGVWFDQRPVTVLGDRRLLVQLFMNLFLNSVEAMGAGGRLMVRMAQDDALQAEVVVTDTGPGIGLGLSREIFNPFYTTKDKPLGLGLPVSRRIVEAHDGHMVVGSDPDGGARVAVRFPGLPLAREKTAVAGGERMERSLN